MPSVTRCSLGQDRDRSLCPEVASAPLRMEGGSSCCCSVQANIRGRNLHIIQKDLLLKYCRLKIDFFFSFLKLKNVLSGGSRFVMERGHR